MSEMVRQEPAAELHQQFSSDGATATPWVEGRERLDKAEVYWLSTVRPDGRPHVTPMVAVWMDGSVYFSTGCTERKAQNLAANSHCIITTGCNVLAKGLDLVIEGDASPVSDKATVERAAEAFAAKYERPFNFKAGDFAAYGEGGDALLFEVRPRRAFGYGRGERYSATRWRFQG
jgi:nitroimidazol reductase NimA-like FMN-containing flavoprotein (pyridoxamine 5'-phosphate oxidase superfamily)